MRRFVNVAFFPKFSGMNAKKKKAVVIVWVFLQGIQIRFTVGNPSLFFFHIFVG